MGSDEGRAERHGRPDNPRSDRLAVSAADPAETASDQARLSYTGCTERGRVRSFTGHVTYLGGAAGERLRGELASGIHDLLTWAATARDVAEESTPHDEDTAA